MLRDFCLFPYEVEDIFLIPVKNYVRILIVTEDKVHTYTSKN